MKTTTQFSDMTIKDLKAIIKRHECLEIYHPFSNIPITPEECLFCFELDRTVIFDAYVENRQTKKLFITRIDHQQ